VVASTERVEAIAALVTLATVAVRHPVLLEVTVLVRLRCLVATGAGMTNSLISQKKTNTIN